MSRSTRATLALAAAKAEFEVLTYDYDPDADRIGMQAAQALGVSPSIVLKTLMAEVDGRPVCVVVPGTLKVELRGTQMPTPWIGLLMLRLAIGL